jgi:hypothetical protein
MQQVQQELQLQASPCPCQHWQQQQQHDLPGIPNDFDEWEEAVDCQLSSTDASSSCDASLSSQGRLRSNGASTEANLQQQRGQEYSIVPTGGGYQPCVKDAAAEAAEGLLRSAAVHGQLLSAGAGTAAIGASSSSSSARLAAALPKEAKSVMQDFYRQYCCVEWPLAAAARCISAAGARSPQAAGSTAKSGSGVAGAGAAGGAGGGAGGGGVVLQPLLPWHVLEGLLVLLNRVSGGLMLHVAVSCLCLCTDTFTAPTGLEESAVSCCVCLSPTKLGCSAILPCVCITESCCISQ